MMKTIHDEMKEKADLALMYARDGAIRTAADKFQEIADEYRKRAADIKEYIDSLGGGDNG